MAKATTTTYLEIESIGTDKLITTMAGLQKSMNFVAGMLKDLNKGLGISSSKAKEGAEAIDAQAKAATEAAQSLTQLRVAMAAQNTAIADITASVGKMAKANEDAKKKGIDWTQLKSKVDLAKQAYSAIKAELTGLFNEAMRLAQAWEVQEQAELKLQAALKTGGMEQSFEDFKQWAGAVQSATTYGDEFVLTLASQAARFAGNEAQTKRATQAALDWASATGRDATQAIKALSGAVNGQADGLKELGIYLTDTEQDWLKNAKEAERLEFVLQKLEGSYKGFSEALATTPTGILTQCQNILGDIDEQVGRLVSPALYAGLSVVKDYLTGQLDEVNAITGSAENLKSVQDDILGGLYTAGAVVIDIKTGLQIGFQALNIAFNKLMEGIFALGKPMAALYDTMAKLPGLADSTRFALQAGAETLRGYSKQAGFNADEAKEKIKELQKEGQKAKDSLANLMLGARDKYNAATETRGQAAGLGGGGLDADFIKDLKDYEAKVKALEDEKARLKAQAKAAAAARYASNAQKEADAADPLDAEMTAYLNFEQNMLATQADFAAKRKALDDSVLIDYETKLGYKKELDTQEQEQLRQLKLDYARSTGDELTILEDKYRQDRLAKEKEAEAQLKAEQKATMEKLAENLRKVTDLGVDMLTSWIEGTGDWRSQLYDAMKSFSTNLMKNALASIINQALVNQANAQGSQAGIPVVGPMLALAAGATMFAVTMALKSKLKPAEVKYASGGYISAGMVRGGAWGRDSVPALLEPGERVLSKKETEAYDSAQSRAVVQNITVNINGQLSTPAQITDTVRRVLVPELKAAARAGYAI